MTLYTESILNSISQPICTLKLNADSFGRLDYGNRAFLTQIAHDPISEERDNFIHSYLVDEMDRILVSNELRALSIDRAHTNIVSVSIALRNGNQRSYHLHINFVDSSTASIQLQPFGEVCGSSSAFLNNHEVVVDFLENAPRACHAVDNSGTILWANKAMLNLLGYASHEYIGRKLSEFIASRDIKEFHNNVEIAQQNKGLLSERIALFTSRNGDIRHNIVSANFRYFEDGRYYSRSILRDDTEKIIRERAAVAEKENEVTKSILDLKRTFVRYVSHETRSPLNVVHGSFMIHVINTSDL